MLVGDLHEAVGRRARCAGRRSVVAGVRLLVRTTLDARLRRQPDIALGLNDERFFVLSCATRQPAAQRCARRALRVLPRTRRRACSPIAALDASRRMDGVLSDECRRRAPGAPSQGTALPSSHPAAHRRLRCRADAVAVR